MNEYLLSEHHRHILHNKLMYSTDAFSTAHIVKEIMSVFYTFIVFWISKKKKKNSEW